MSFYTYLILLDPRAGSGIFVWTKMPLLPLHPPLTYLWAPHVSFFFFFPSPAAVAALHPQALARTPRPCARAAAASSEVEKTAVVGAAPAPESPPASRARWPSSGGGACELPRQRRRAPRPRRSGSAPELGVLHRQRPSAPPRRAELAHAEPLLPDPHALAGAAAPRSPALRTRPLLPPALAPAASRGGRVRRASRGGRRRRGGARGGGRREQARGGRTHRRWGG